MPPTFADFFRRATGHRPYPFQERFATGRELPHLVRAPTGSGKTATAVLGWLYRWVNRETYPGTPRRLVYCLPMRVLVEQSEREARRWLAELKIAVPVHVLMGGVEAEKWHLHPEEPAVLIGTQDMLLSRALNRGYGASRFHWPIDFGLLNSDCLWVFDEPQLMANGVGTSAQLAGLRDSLKTAAPCPSVWMSATLEPGWLDTVDFRGKSTAPPLELTDADYADPRLDKRMSAKKTLGKLGTAAAKDGKGVAAAVWAEHGREPGAQTLVVLNTVDRAKAVYEELGKLRKKAATPAPALLLVHSRFRPAERERLNAALTGAAADRIVVATQVVEAGVDISSRTLVTELAPWASVVQRIGRCNRTGDDGPGRVFWIDLDEKLAPPYEPADLDFARGQLVKLDRKDVSPKALDEFKRAERITLPFEHAHVVRRRDVLDLFDTAPDLSGNDLDISRFVRSDDPDADVQVFWRDLPADGPGADEPQPVRRELCNVPVGQAREFLKALADKRRGPEYVWDHLDDEWVPVDPHRVRPGLQILLPAPAGGYSDLGWDPGSSAAVGPVPPAGDEAEPGEAAGSDPNSEAPRPLTVAEHTANVCRELDALLAELPLDGWAEHLRTAARWHDAGKGHGTFQRGVRAVNADLDPGRVWAKSGRAGRLRYDRPHFRHELASALAALRNAVPFGAAYLTGAHHGRVRLGIRALPGEGAPFALGVRDGDVLPAVDLGGGVGCPETPLDLTPMRLGGAESWTARALALLADLGPFRLAYLEAVLRAADVRASREEAAGG